MKKHIFLTGDVQIGKSTAISKALKLLKIIPGGFRTFGVNYQEDGSSDVFIFPANSTPEYGYRVAHRTAGCKIIFREIFDEFGSFLLKQQSELILMDELGYMESAALKFQQTVFETLDGTVPVLGVVRNKDTPFLNAVRARDDVLVLTVTENNRDYIPEKIVYFFSSALKKEKESGN
ncbi:MAG TPA: hypothetical protein O0X32_02835 [Methanocorpusculum sp.]|nr:hypothetical protein [Methanocorpusculum sp.]